MISFLVFVPRKIAMTSTSALDSTPAGAAARLKRKRGGVATPSVNITAAAAAADTQHASGSWVGSCHGLLVGLLGGCCGVAGGLLWACWPVLLVGLVVALVQNKSAEKSWRCVYKNATSSPA